MPPSEGPNSPYISSLCEGASARPDVGPSGRLFPSPRTLRLVPMTWAAARAWVQSYNAAVEAAHERCRRGETFEAMDLNETWVEGRYVSDSCVPRGCFNFAKRPYSSKSSPLAHILPRRRFELFGPVLGAPGDRRGWQKLPISGPEDVRWAGWRKSRHWRLGGTEPLPQATEGAR